MTSVCVARHSRHYGGADAPFARGSQPRSSDLAELSRSRAGRPPQAKGPPHKQMPESGKTKWHWLGDLPHKSPNSNTRGDEGSP